MGDRRKMQLKFNFFTGLFAWLIFLFLTRYGFANLYLHFLGKEIGRTLTLLLFAVFLALTLLVYTRFLRVRISWGRVFMLGLIPNCMLIVLRYPYLFKVVSYVALAAVLYLVAMNLWEERDALFTDRSRRRRRRARKEFLGACISTFLEIGGEYLMIAMLFFLLGVFGPYFHISVNIPGLSAAAAYSANVAKLYGNTHQELGEQNRDELARLCESQYYELSLEEKLNTLQTVLNVETRFLGCDPVQLIGQEIPEKGLAGYYNLESSAVAINQEIVERDVEQAVHVVLHEAYHVYQEACCRSVREMELTQEQAQLRFYQDILRWDYEFSNYHQCEDPSDPADYYRYASQQIELTAEEYSDTWITFYRDFIDVPDGTGK